MALHHTEYKKNYKSYILDCLDSEDDLTDKSLTEQEKINYLFDRFNSEYGFMVQRVGKQNALAEWLSGLAINIDYYYEDIIKLAVKMGSIDANPSEELQERVCNNYWNFMANIILSLEPNKEG
jgi:hypothetical protein|tara:strand:- start:54 stop:422 length:369 start_codon:yes stop_codon:yes gene_type:complete